MAFSQGPDLGLIQTERLGFLSLAGDAKVRLTSPWSPAPAAHASLISIASRKGLVAAAGPDYITFATTEAVRKAFESPKDGDSDVRPFQPHLKLNLPVRICQLAFTADENYLIMSAEQGGGLAVYDVQALLQGSTETAFQIPTNGEALRALVPNPRPEKGELCAIVTEKGNLLMANMKERTFVPGPNGQILKTQVSCVAWSTKGKQLVAGLGDGTIHQMTPEGDVKAQIPRPPSLDSNYFVSFLIWLENDLFLAVYVSAAEQPPQSVYHLITRQGQTFGSQKLPDPVDPFGSEKVPHHTAARLKDFPPNLQDLLVFSSTATPDIGLLTRAKAPLSEDNIANVFTTTELLDDSKRATLPMGENFDTPAPIGTALDLSSKEPVDKPIPSDEMAQSPGPIPGYWVLNEEGVLSVWWIIYTESIRGGTTYPGMAVVEGSTEQTAAAPPQLAQTAQASPFGTPSTSAFGKPAAAPTPAFGSTTTLGAKPSVWGASSTAPAGSGGASFGSSTFGSGMSSTAPKFGAPSFGTPSAFGQPSSGSAFGQSSGLGAKSSPWGAAASSTIPAFGQSGFASAAKGPGGTFGSAAGSSGGFASFANQGGFASLGTTNDTNTSIFATSKPAGAEDSSMEAESTTSFPPPSSSAKPVAGSGGVFGTQPFKLISSFKPDGPAKPDENSTVDSSGEKSLFGSGFASAMGESTKPSGFGLFGNQPSSSSVQSTTPTTTPAPSKFMSLGPTAGPTGGLFGYTAKNSTSLFGTPSTSTPLKTEADTPKAMKDIPEAPLPPESINSPDTRKAPSDAPLPPDFLSTKSKPEEKLPPAPESPPAVNDAPLPPDPIKNKKIYDVKFPPLPGESKPKTTNDAPLPPDPMTNKKVYEVKFPPLPGSQKSPSIFGTPAAKSSEPAPTPKQQSIFGSMTPKTSDKGSASKVESIFKSSASMSGFKFPTNLPPASLSDDDEDEEAEDEENSNGDEDDEEEEEDDDDVSDEGSEGSGVDVAKDLSPPSETKNKTTPTITPGSSFDGLSGSFSTISRPEPERKSLFGEIGRSVPNFPQPNPLSPRSPSPVRSAVPSRIIGGDKRSFSAPGMASQILGASKRPQSRGAPIVSKEAPLEDPRFEQQRRARAKKEAEEMQLLVDEEDERKQNELKAPIQPTLVLDEFIAHAGPLPSADDSIPAQVEAVYRDINAMIDTLGLNARALTNFIKGHAETFRHERRDKADLSNPDVWTIGELEDLHDIVTEDLVNELEDARVTDVEEKIAECQELQRDLTRDRSKRNDLQKLIASRLDPDQALANRSLPLTAEQAARQNDLRRDFARFTKLLAEAEESLAVLRAKIVSANAAQGKTGSTPTVEAVMRTITKMTSMVEKRSGDIDVLENQMRKLRFSSPGLGASRSREGTPTPKKLGASLAMFSPERGSGLRESMTPQRGGMSVRHSMSNSISSIGGGMFALRTPPRKKMSGFGEAEKKAVKERRARRSVVLSKLKASVEKKGPSVWAVEDIE
ncbi:hypothetical protein BX600DRAFT_172671 [Xylariales sp. PMI_506]|nr:hypothetical protein BX600DRAFT_172671 [Xylariales sp. PMI_506]